jgi:hypothetical protein
MSHFPEPIGGYTLEVEVGALTTKVVALVPSALFPFSLLALPHYPLFATTRSFSLLQYAVLSKLRGESDDLGIAFDR